MAKPLSNIAKGLLKAVGKAAAGARDVKAKAKAISKNVKVKKAKQLGGLTLSSVDNRKKKK
jgi:hypothetical protein